MKTSQRRFIGVGILITAILAAAAFQIFGHGLIVVTEVHPITPPEMTAKNMDMAGGQIIDYSRVCFLTIIGIVGFIVALLPNQREKSDT